MILIPMPKIIIATLYFLSNKNISKKTIPELENLNIL
jgi:hypothetical protein